MMILENVLLQLPDWLIMIISIIIDYFVVNFFLEKYAKLEIRFK